MQMGVAAELQIGEDDHHHMSTSNIWLNRRRSASCKGAARSNHCDIGSKKKTSGSENTASDHGDASKKKQLCLCAPTTHAGSFKCRLHRATDTATAHNPLASSSMKCSVTGKASYSSINLDVQALPHLSRFGRAVVAASASASASAGAGAGGSRPISMALQNDE